MSHIQTLTEWLATTLAVLMAALMAGLGFAPNGGGPTTLAGYADADYIRIGPELAGRLVELGVTRGTLVKPGSLLFRQDTTADQATLEQVRAQLAAARALLANLQTGKRPAEIEVLTAQLHESEAQAQLAERQLARRSRLAETKVASVQDLDIARADLEVKRARVGSLAAQIKVAQLPARPDEVKAAEAQVTANQAASEQAAWRLAQRAVTNTAFARVEDVLHWPGEMVAAGAPVVVMVPPAAIKVRLYVPEPLVGGIKPGQTVALRCDGCGQGISGHVVFISSQAEYTPPVIYSTGNREKLVFLVEIRPDSDPERLHPGQPVDVTLGPPPQKYQGRGQDHD
ncbi:MAG: HlyD family efflux transporter periplasmic adaptor subunit [Rhodospirillaceae bacterium]